MIHRGLVNMKIHYGLSGILILLALLMLVGQQPHIAYLQTTSRLFPETGKTVQGRFLEYWQANGGLAQQGFPISEEMQEQSDINGKVYEVQYFERALFERHPENAAPNDVLLALLGRLHAKQKYPSGFPRQTPNVSTDSVFFTETGHRLGGRFLAYWRSSGGLAQQGYPISDEFTEVSELDGKSYTVQYFERAVFELHPENSPPHDVLLSQLGTFRYKNRHVRPSPTRILTPTLVPTGTPVPTITPTPVDLMSCEGVPPPVDMRVDPPCGALYDYFTFRGYQFYDDDFAGVYITLPDGKVFGAPFQVRIDQNAETQSVRVQTNANTPFYGIWTITMEGVKTHRKVYGYFKVIPHVPTPCPHPDKYYCR
jgi:hypothetical protein